MRWGFIATHFVAFWHLADIETALIHVRFWG
jgi:hypothetical protein